MVFDHKVHDVLIRENIRLEVVFEAAPIYCGDYFQLVLRLRHMGSEIEYEELKLSLSKIESELLELKETYSNILNNVGIDETIENIDSLLNQNKLISFFTKNFQSESETNSKNDMDNSQLQEKWNQLVSKRSSIIDELDFHKPVTMMGSDLYMTGIFKYSKLAIDSMKLEKSSKLPSLFYADHYNPRNEDGTVSETDVVPFYLIPQSLLFTEKTLTAGSVYSFKVKSMNALPTDLPASYISISNNFSIAYHLCLDLFLLDGKTQVPEHFPMKVPLFVHPYFDQKGKQNVCKLDGEIKIDSPFDIKEIKETNQMNSLTSVRDSKNLSKKNDETHEQVVETEIDELSQKVDEAKITQNSDETDSNMCGNSAEFAALLKDEFKKLASSIDPDNFEEDELCKKILEFQAKQDSEYLSKSKNNNNPEIPSSLMSPVVAKKSSIHHTENLQKVVSYLNSVEDLIYKQEYVINRNSESIVKVKLNKLVYKTNEDIHVELNFPSSEKFKVTSVLSILESHEIINPKYSLFENSQNMKNSTNNKQNNETGFSIYENHNILFDDTQSLAMKFIPYSFNNFNLIPSIFKNNIFQHKYMIKIQLVLIDKHENVLMNSLTQDKYGKNFKASSSLDGEILQFYIPVLMLPA